MFGHQGVKAVFNRRQDAPPVSIKRRHQQGQAQTEATDQEVVHRQQVECRQHH